MSASESGAEPCCGACVCIGKTERTPGKLRAGVCVSKVHAKAAFRRQGSHLAGATLLEEGLVFT